MLLQFTFIVRFDHIKSFYKKERKHTCCMTIAIIWYFFLTTPVHMYVFCKVLVCVTLPRNFVL